MKKTIQLLGFIAVAFAVVNLQSCDNEDPTAAPVATGPTAVASVQVGTKADVTFTYVAAGGYASSAVTATGGTAAVKTDGEAGAVEGSVVVEFTADNTAGAATVTITITDGKGQAGNTATATLNKTISAPPTVTLSAAAASGNPGATVQVTATVTAANGFKNLTYTTTGGLTGSPESPINSITGSTQVLTFTIPASAAIGATMTAVITVSDNQSLNSTAQTFTVTATTNELTGTLAANMTLNKGSSYLIKNTFIVPSGLTLTVQAGAVIKGDKATKGVLVIKQGGTLIADGSETEPIVFTSAQPVGARDRGDWGGIIIMGDAFVNQTAQPSVEGLSPPASDANFYKYGTVSISNATLGTNNQNSGKLEYVRIEYAGIELIPNSESNGLTMAAVGDGTTIDYVQVSYGGDDGFEWFGGTVNAKHLVSLATWDDDFDTDFGWRGKVQWGVAVRAASVADQSGSTSFESDSQANANAIGTICTDAAAEKSGCTSGVFSNITVLGPRELNRTISGNYTRAMHIRRRSAISIFNSVITGYHAGLQMDDNGTTTNYAVDNTGAGRLSNNLMMVSYIPASTSVSSATPVTSVPLAAGNVAYGGASLNGVSAQTIWEGAAATNTLMVPYFYSKYSNSPTNTVQAISGTWAATASTQAGTDVLFATVPGWTAGTAVEVTNPYTALGINFAAFYAGSTTGNYPSNPALEISGSGTLATGASFTDPKLTTFFTAVNYKGAFGTTDWTNTWTEFQPLNKAY